MPLVITFRALRDNARVNRFDSVSCSVKISLITVTSGFKLCKSSNIPQSIYLPSFSFASTVLEDGKSTFKPAMQSRLLMSQMRDLFYDWKVATWPRKYGQKEKYQQASVLYQPLDEWDNGGGLGPNPRPVYNDDDDDGDGYSLNTFDNSVTTKKGWLAFAFGS